MLKIRNFEVERLNSEGLFVRAEISVSDTSELATMSGDYTFVEGSVAWDISSGDFYGLNSSGEWINQNGTGTYSASASQSLSVSDINRYVMQPISDTNEIIPDNESEVIKIEPEPVRDLESR